MASQMSYLHVIEQGLQATAADSVAPYRGAPALWPEEQRT